MSDQLNPNNEFNKLIAENKERLKAILHDRDEELFTLASDFNDQEARLKKLKTSIASKNIEIASLKCSL